MTNLPPICVRFCLLYYKVLFDEVDAVGICPYLISIAIYLNGVIVRDETEICKEGVAKYYT